MKSRITLIALFVALPMIGFTQSNDTIFYKSGTAKVVEITSFTSDIINYLPNQLAGTKESSVNRATVFYFKMYDNEGVLTYNSAADGNSPAPPTTTTTTTTTTEPNLEAEMKKELSVSKHTLSFNPFLLPFASANLKYNFTFGEKMQYSVTSRVTYLSGLLEDFDFFGDLMIGAGVRLNPVYSKHFVFGVDFTPMVGLYTRPAVFENNDPHFLFPLNVNFDFLFNDKLGLTIDTGIGTNYQSGNYGVMGRFHFGLLWQFKGKKTFERPY